MRHLPLDWRLTEHANSSAQFLAAHYMHLGSRCPRCAGMQAVQCVRAAWTVMDATPFDLTWGKWALAGCLLAA